MGRIGKISTIKKEYSRNTGSLESSLAMNGFQRFPGTGIRIVPAKSPNGKYITGLDYEKPYPKYMLTMGQQELELEIERIKELREKLEAQSGLDLGPKSEYYSQIYNDNVQHKAQIVRLIEGDNIFNLEDDVFQAITFEWLRNHPLIASSWQAYEQGKYPSNTQFYVNDDNIEQEITFKKKTAMNKAISLLETLSLERRKKVARMLGLPVTDNSKEMFVYNLLDSFLKQPEVRDGEYKGANPVKLFVELAEMKDKLLHVKDVIEQAITQSILRVKAGRVYNGHEELAKSKEDYLAHLMKDKADNQEDLLALEKQLEHRKQILT